MELGVLSVPLVPWDGDGKEIRSGFGVLDEEDRRWISLCSFAD